MSRPAVSVGSHDLALVGYERVSDLALGAGEHYFLRYEVMDLSGGLKGQSVLSYAGRELPAAPPFGSCIVAEVEMCPRPFGVVFRVKQDATVDIDLVP